MRGNSKKILKSSEIIVLVSGGHGFETLEQCEMIEVKQGPYNENKDKKKFDEFSKKIKIIRKK